MNYAEMTDFEINSEVAAKVGGFLAKDIFEKEQTIFKWYPGNKYSKFDPCNSWADAGPIIAENQISIIFDADSMIEPPAHWVTCRYVSSKGDFSEYYGQPDRPLRAAMIAFLMIQETK